MLTVILGLVGLAVDVANVRFTAERIQRAAEAGALAGVPYLPSDLTDTHDRATALIQANGVTIFGSPNPASCPAAAGTVCASYTADTTTRQLTVTITDRVKTYFLGLFNRGSITVSRTAVAAYSDPIPMGAPDHELGFAPYPTHAIDCAGTSGTTECRTSTTQHARGFWLQVTVPVATTYAPTAPNDWWKVNYNLSGCTSSPCGHAIVTWGIASGSAPVHLIKQY